MRFESITINNLYSYRLGSFDFATPTSEQNVVLIHGRNGYGKTSFINAVKLLFLGSGDRDLHRSVRSGHSYSEAEFLLGKGEEWEGVFNRRARSEGEQNYSVEIRWREGRSGSVTAKRAWKLNQNGRIFNTLEIKPSFQVDEDELADEESKQAFLDKRLPRALLPLFIYDAEQVQRLAEANSDGTLGKV